MTLAVQMKDNLGSGSGGRLPSASIWGDCPILSILEGTRSGVMIIDDFERGFITPTITTLINVDGYACFGSAGATITWDDATGGGVVLTEATDNESVSMTCEQHPFWLNSSKGDLWFEARFKTSTITTNQQGFMIGLMDTTALSAAVPVTATGTIADVNFVGFHKPEANTTAFDASYKANGVAAVEVNSDIGTLAVNTYIKVGMKFTSADNILAFYVNGLKQAATKTLGAAAGTDFPDDIGLAPVIGQTLGASASITLTMDWWRCVQLG
jgi:hypothetical protein